MLVGVVGVMKLQGAVIGEAATLAAQLLLVAVQPFPDLSHPERHPGSLARLALQSPVILAVDDSTHLECFFGLFRVTVLAHPHRRTPSVVNIHRPCLINERQRIV